MQREIKSGFLVEAGYSAIIGTHLIASLLNYDQVDINTLPARLNIYTAAGRNLLNTTFDNKNQLVELAGFSKPESARVNLKTGRAPVAVASQPVPMRTVSILFTTKNYSPPPVPCAGCPVSGFRMSLPASPSSFSPLKLNI